MKPNPGWALWIEDYGEIQGYCEFLLVPLNMILTFVSERTNGTVPHICEGFEDIFK